MSSGWDFYQAYEVWGRLDNVHVIYKPLLFKIVLNKFENDWTKSIGRVHFSKCIEMVKNVHKMHNKYKMADFLLR